ncbi:transporter [Lewinella sp. IMCC34183]|uniref:transporter n=1 Tax=Lewinella sp. IMCC34183 TaxID=2248762 RepID=UPI000E222CFC|nr:transporter [Lewinella sp. IMCC34183]
MQHVYVFGLLALPALLAGQYSETINSGRPGQSIGAVPVGRDIYQLETGLSINWIGEGGNQIADYAETTTIRVGVLERLEVNVDVSGASVLAPADGPNHRDRGINNTEIGIRYQVFEQRGWRPALAVQGHLLLTAQDEDFRRPRTGSSFTLIADWEFSEALLVTANLLRSYNGDGTQNTEYVTTLGMELSDRWSTYMEVYGALSETVTANYDGGFAFLIADDVAADVSAGWQGQDGLNDYFLDFGISFRINGRRSMLPE